MAAALESQKRFMVTPLNDDAKQTVTSTNVAKSCGFGANMHFASGCAKIATFAANRRRLPPADGQAAHFRKLGDPASGEAERQRSVSETK
jgi:hypothetical protein